jgi:Fe-S-cluster-containing hydrogenase component 2
VKACAFDAITITSFLAYIDFQKCTLCRKCVEVCPTNAIHEINFKPRKPKVETETPEKSVSLKPFEDKNLSDEVALPKLVETKEEIKETKE